MPVTFVALLFAFRASDPRLAKETKCKSPGAPDRRKLRQAKIRAQIGADIIKHPLETMGTQLSTGEGLVAAAVAIAGLWCVYAVPAYLDMNPNM
jgi:hypothetical protein